MEQKDYRLAAILYTDIAGFSRMMEKDEAATLRVLGFHNTLIAETAKLRHGSVIKTIGDAFLVDFRNTVEALQAALEIQDKFYQYNLEHTDLPLLVRMGVHLGDIYFFEDDALGEGINIAARLQSLAHPGAICISQDVYNQVLNKIDFHAERLGKVSLKNITKEIHAYEIFSANVEFDPNRGGPRPGFPPGAYAEAPLAAHPETDGPGADARRAEKPADKSHPARDYSPEGSANVLAEIRSAILADIKSEGRRLSVEEALQRYGEYGVEAQEVIARMAEQGLLTKRGPPPSESEAGFDGEALGRDIERAVRGIVSVVEDRIGEYAGGRHREPGRERHGRYERREEHWERRAERRSEESGADSGDRAYEAETEKWDKKLKNSDYFKPGRENRAASFAEYRSELEKKARKMRGGLTGNLVAFVGVNALLWGINLNMHTGAPFYWAAIVTAGWGTGLISNIAGLVRANKKVKEADRVPDLEGEALDTYKKLNTLRDSMLENTVSVVTVPALLFTIYTIATPFIFPWWLIPSGIIAISWLSHLIAYGSARKRLETNLFAQAEAPGGWKDLFRIGKTRKAMAPGPYASLYAEAEAAKNAIVAQIRSAGKDSPFDKELIPSLEEYVGQVKLLAQTVQEIDAIVDSIPMKELAKDKVELQGKMGTPTSASLRSEYLRSIEEIEKQEKSYEELRDQREILHLRLKSSVNSLKQTQLDMARLRANPDAAQAASLDQLRSKTGELSRYLEDIKKGYEETGDAVDPWKDLERAALERESSAKLQREKAPSPAEGGKHPPRGEEGIKSDR